MSEKEMPKNAPVLTRIFFEEVSQKATPDIKKRLYETLEKRLADEQAANSKRANGST